MSFRQGLDDFYTRYILGVREEQPTGIKSVTIPLDALMFGSWGILFRNMRNFCLLGGIFALAMTLLSFASGAVYTCAFQDVLAEDIWFCAENRFLRLSGLLAWVTLLAYYLCVWRRALSEKGLSAAAFRPEIKNVAKILGLNVLFLCCCLIPLMSLLLLIWREPDPDWRLESVYFGIVSLGFFTPLIMIRLGAWWVQAAEGQTLSSPVLLWNKNAGNMLKTLMSLGVIVLGAMFFFSGFKQNFAQTESLDSLYLAAVSEFLYNFCSLFFITLFFNFALVQKQYLFENSGD